MVVHLIEPVGSDKTEIVYNKKGDLMTALKSTITSATLIRNSALLLIVQTYTNSD